MIAGGVAANKALRATLEEEALKKGIKVYYPSMVLCTDNGAMIAAGAYYKLKYHKEKAFGDLNLNGKATLSIEED